MLFQIDINNIYFIFICIRFFVVKSKENGGIGRKKKRNLVFRTGKHSFKDRIVSRCVSHWLLKASLCSLPHPFGFAAALYLTMSFCYRDADLKLRPALSILSTVSHSDFFRFLFFFPPPPPNAIFSPFASLQFFSLGHLHPKLDKSSKLFCNWIICRVCLDFSRKFAEAFPCLFPLLMMILDFRERNSSAELELASRTHVEKGKR